MCTSHNFSLIIHFHFGSEKAVILGLIQTKHSFISENCVEMVNSHLANLRIQVKTDLVCCTANMANNMVKVARLITSIHQVYFVHGAHL